MKSIATFLSFRADRVYMNDLGNKRLALGNASWLVAAHFLRWIAALFGGVLVARYLGPEQFGSYRFAAAIVTICIPLWTLGLTSILSKELIESPGQQNSILGTSLLLRFLAGIFGSIAVIITMKAFTEIDTNVIIFTTILSVGGCFSSLEALRSWFEIRAGARYFVPIQIFATYVAAVTKALLVLAKAPVIFFVAIGSLELATAGVAIFIAFLRQGQKISAFAFRVDLARRLLSYSWPILLSGFASAIYLKIDQLMLGMMVSYEASGVYAVAANISEMWYVLATIWTASAFPFLMRLKDNDAARYSIRLQQGYDLLFIAALSLALVVTPTAKPIINFLYGESYASAAPVLMIHIWAGLFLFMRELFSKWLVMEGLYIYFFYTSVVGAVSNILLNVALIPIMHEVGAAIATVVSYAGAGMLSALIFPRTRAAGWMMVRSLTSPFRVVLGPRAYLLALRSGSA